MLDIGPQYDGDDAFTARMRLHQSWYRAQVLGVECGVGPQRTATKRYGNMLRAEDGARGLNFLTPEISSYAKARQAEFPSGIKGHRLFCNTLSSQPMCFNLFAPLALDDGIAPAMLSALLGAEVARIGQVIIEYSPTPKSEYLDDATSFDAFVEYWRSDGKRGFVGIETKLTEPFSQTHYPQSKPSYARWVDHPAGPWLPAAREGLDAVLHNQLWRDHMLGFAYAERAVDRFGAWSVAVVRHPLDQKCGRALAAYGRCVRPYDGTLLDRPLDAFVERLRPVVRGTRWSDWLRECERRYVDLSESDHLVQERNRAG